ncbi:MAG: ATP-binding cassette domain-containing protein [Fibrobacteria bacterium]|nr:ATP-binding cassette domain-containing protein [Fibrobacteria bacterium]
MTAFPDADRAEPIPTASGPALVIEPGRDREGSPEGFPPLRLVPGDLLAVVGPTGCGKSRLLADIEWLSEGDSPSGRKVRLEGFPAGIDEEETGTHHRVAQLSQTMQFTLDLDVGSFLDLHARSREVPDAETVARAVVEAACTLCGEPFTARTHLSGLSGGQSRALMIADTALLAAAPIVLVDEVENAGVDRRRAMDLLVSRDKIVLMATHDPLLALLAPRRLVLARGGIRRIRDRTPGEEFLLASLEEQDLAHTRLRDRLRAGHSACESEI